MPFTTLIRTQNLRVRDFGGLPEFYCGLLGMQSIQEAPDHEAAETLVLGFDPDQCSLVFRKANVSPFTARPNDFYWKIGITLQNLNAAVAFLRDNEINVTDPRQFRDIGYMSKITDPNGFIIELLQQSFEGSEKVVPEGHPVGAQATLAHITLRVTDIASAKDYFGKKLGMRLMSVQPVEDFDFCLYFYSWSDEELPNSDLFSVANREWLWARPYTLIELQHLQSTGASVNKSASTESGFDGFAYGKNQADGLSFVSVNDLEHLS